MSRKLFGNAAIYLGANILNAGIPFLLLPILTHVLTPADYGIVAMFSVVVSILGAFIQQTPAEAKEALAAAGILVRTTFAGVAANRWL